MKKNTKEFREIENLKERQMLRIRLQEMKIQSGIRDLSDQLNGAAVISRIRDNLFTGQGLAYKLGFLAVSLITDRIKNRRKRKK